MTETNVTEKIVGETEEKVNKTEVKVDLSSIQAGLKDMLTNFKEEVLSNVKSILAEEKMKQLPPVIPEVKEDKTKGIVKEEVEKEEKKEEDGLILEKADFGKGFQIWRDYNKENSGKFKRLIRG